MIAHVSRNINHALAKNGPLMGLEHEFVSKHGIPVFFFERSDAAAMGEGYLVERAKPGMVGIDCFGTTLYTVLADRTVSALPVQVLPITPVFPPDHEQESQLA